MKPAPFEYLVARSPEEVVAALAGGDTHVLAGGQSLILAMNLRLVRPARVVDINRVAAFDRLEVADKALHIGPLVRHRAFETPPRPRPAGNGHARALRGAGAVGRLLALVAPYVGHPPIRTRGTLVGSLAEAHPAAEWPAVVAMLDGKLDLTGPDGTRTVGADGFVTGPFRTTRRPEELLARVRLPLLPAGTGVGFVEHRRTEASFADLAVAAALTIRDGTIDAVRLGLVNAAGHPVRARAAEAALVGRPATPAVFTEAAQLAGHTDADPPPRPDADTGYRRHAVTVLVRRALQAALRDAAGDAGAAGAAADPGGAPDPGDTTTTTGG